MTRFLSPAGPARCLDPYQMPQEAKKIVNESVEAYTDLYVPKRAR